MTKQLRPDADLTPFGRWLLDRLDERSMTRIDLAKAIDRPSGLVSKWFYRNNPLPPGCGLIAGALKLPVDQVLEAAGHRPVLTRSASKLRHEAETLLLLIPEPLLVPLIPMLRGLATHPETTLLRVAQAIKLDDE